MAAHAAKFGSADDLYIGLPLTHSGRYSRPTDDARLEPVTAYAHPLLDEKFHCTAADVVSDAEVKNIIRHFVAAAKLAQAAGFDFVDIKMAHGYLGHEFLSAFTRPGEYGGSFENRTRFFREIVEGIRREVPGLELGNALLSLRLPAVRKGEHRWADRWKRERKSRRSYRYAFGGDGTGLGYDLTEPIRFLELAQSLGVELICTTVCSPYNNPHFQRPAYYPVSDGYLPPEDPVIGANRQIQAVAAVKAHFQHSSMRFIGACYACLQDYLTQVGQHAVRSGQVDFVGIGRMVLAYPNLCADTLDGKPLDIRHLCRTFGDCTTASRNGMVSGCYPLDEFYKAKPECARVREIKRMIAGLKK